MLQGLYTAVFVLAVLFAKDRIVACWIARHQPPPVVHDNTAIFSAVQQAAQTIGMNGAALTPASDLVASGKVYDLLHHAAIALGKDHELRTVQDLIDWLAEAPTR